VFSVRYELNFLSRGVMKENFRFQRHKQERSVDFTLFFPSHGHVLQTTKVEFLNICYGFGINFSNRTGNL
jgi:hypothetical protein